jgi:hypothetical protein
VFECHITVEPVREPLLLNVRIIAESHGFRLADLLMRKRGTTTLTRSEFDTFMTGHSELMPPLEQRMMAVISEVKAIGVKVYRYKIEKIVYDSRNGDHLGIL